MRLTRRTTELFEFIRPVRWATTSQIHRRFSAGVSKDAVRKWLRNLTSESYLRRVQENRMRDALFTLGPEGKRALEKIGGAEIRLEPRPPQNLAHHLGLTDLRISAELSGALDYYFAYWELPVVGWQHRIIPDAIFSIRGRQFAMEFDRGLETIRYFVRTKISMYARGLDDFPLAALLVVADREARMKTLARAIKSGSVPVLFTTIDLLRERSILAPVFYRDPNGTGERIV